MWCHLTSPSPFLPEYFGPYLGEYVNVLAALEKLNVAILKAMDKTKEVSEDVSASPPQFGGHSSREADRWWRLRLPARARSDRR